jgi:hypothetical protein
LDGDFTDIEALIAGNAFNNMQNNYQKKPLPIFTSAMEFSLK